jgi:hypothetical protein
MVQWHTANCSSDVLNEVLEDKLISPRLWPTRCLDLILVIFTCGKKQENKLYSSNQVIRWTYVQHLWTNVTEHKLVSDDLFKRL